MDELSKCCKMLDEMAENINKINQSLYKMQPDFCPIGLSQCSCGWVGKYPRSGCPNCQRTFVD